MPIDEDKLAIWVVYQNPRDRPGKCIARKWLNDQPTDEVLVAATLDELRAMLPPGLTRLGRRMEDDPVIVETWL